MSRQGSKSSTERLLAQLEHHCSQGNLRPLVHELENQMSLEVLTRFRERKMILRVPSRARQTVCLAMQQAANQLGAEHRRQFDRYLMFAVTTDAARSQVLAKLRTQLRLFPSCSTGDLLDVADEVFEAFAVRTQRAIYGRLKNPGVAEGERQLHDLNGHLVDLAQGIARTVNEFARSGLLNPSKRQLQRRERSRALEAMQRVVLTAANLNSLDWIFDSVTFGDFTVADGIAGPKAEFRLDFADPRVALMRRLATRRSFILKHAGQRAARWVREKLNALQEPLVEEALQYYSSVERVRLSEDDVQKAREMARKSLVFIDAEDDLMLAAGRMGLRIQSFYTVGMALRCFAMASSIVKSVTSESKRMLGASAIPTDLITAGFDDGAGGALLKEAVARLSVELPVRRHEQILASAFVRDGVDFVRPFLGGESGMWNVVVREALLQGGALGKSVGAVWEDFTKISFDGTDWKVVGHGVKLRENGTTLTDVDLMLVREDLLLLVQIKALIGSANTTYDHWKNRQVIEAGCAQARVAADFFARRADSLISICGRRVAQAIRVIQPVVLTNIGHLDGYSHRDVPVIGEATRKAICKGSKVDYYKSNPRELVHSHVFVDQDALNTTEILRLLREPIELLIAAEKPETVHRRDELGSVVFHMPEFATREGGFQPPDLNSGPHDGVKGGPPPLRE